MPPKLDISVVQSILNTYANDYQSLIIASTNAAHEPLSSYAPFIKKGNDFYILISKTAPHYSNLMNHPIASIMLIQEESEASSIFFRKRVTYSIESTKVEANQDLIQAFQASHGEMVSMLIQLDFSFFKLTIRDGLIVLGPAQAYVIDSSNQVVAQQGAGSMGHRPQEK